MDGDPALFVRKLDHQHLFDGQAFSQEDLKRSESYQPGQDSAALWPKRRNLDSYLGSLGMKARLTVARSVELP